MDIRIAYPLKPYRIVGRTEDNRNIYLIGFNRNKNPIVDIQTKPSLVEEKDGYMLAQLEKFIPQGMNVNNLLVDNIKKTYNFEG
jgi:hypothetical protein